MNFTFVDPTSFESSTWIEDVKDEFTTSIRRERIKRQEAFEKYNNSDDRVKSYIDQISKQFEQAGLEFDFSLIDWSDFQNSIDEMEEAEETEFIHTEEYYERNFKDEVDTINKQVEACYLPENSTDRPDDKSFYVTSTFGNQTIKSLKQESFLTETIKGGKDLLVNHQAELKRLRKKPSRKQNKKSKRYHEISFDHPGYKRKFVAKTNKDVDKSIKISEAIMLYKASFDKDYGSIIPSPAIMCLEKQKPIIKMNEFIFVYTDNDAFYARLLENPNFISLDDCIADFNESGYQSFKHGFYDTFSCDIYNSDKRVCVVNTKIDTLYRYYSLIGNGHGTNHIWIGNEIERKGEFQFPSNDDYTWIKYISVNSDVKRAILSTYVLYHLREYYESSMQRVLNYRGGKPIVTLGFTPIKKKHKRVMSIISVKSPDYRPESPTIK